VTLDPGVFKAYDVRGVVPDELDADGAYRIARAYVDEFEPTRIAVGHDMRLTSEELSEAAIRGALDAGCDVDDIGLAGTEMMYFAVGEYGYEGGFTITASHNPSRYNGLKMVRRGALPVGGPDGNFPTTSPTRCCPRTASSSSRRSREGADLGIAWDGDADRCFFIDDTGEFVDGDFLTALLAESLLRSVPGEAILYDVRASRAVPDTVERPAARAAVNRVGHAFFKTRMREEGALFGGEVSGPLLLPRLLLRGLGHDPGAARARAALA
jgi:phosphomannomutase